MSSDDSPRLRILFLSADPSGMSRHRFEREAREIAARIRSAKHREAVEIVSRWAVRPEDLGEALLEIEPHVVHFAGHGTEGAEIVLDGGDGKERLVGKDALAQLFGVLQHGIRVVVLNACHSRAQARAITEHIECAIGVPKELDAEAGITFAASFYQGLGYGRSIRQAFELGLASLKMQGLAVSPEPELLLREGADGGRPLVRDGRVLAPPTTEEPSSPPPSRHELSPRHAGRNLIPVILVVAFAVACALVVAAALWQWPGINGAASGGPR
jgi:hypothetical protein